MKGKESEGDKLMRRATQLCKASLLEMRLKPDWNTASPLYEQAANAYKSAKSWEKSKAAYEKTATCQEQLGSSWHAGKMYEKAAEMAKEQQDFVAMAELYTHAAEMFFEAGRPQTGSEALYKAARKMEDADVEQASTLYQSALDALEQDERFSIGRDLYRSAVSHELRRERFEEAAGLLMKFAAVCETRSLHVSVGRSYLGAIVIWLYRQNMPEAENVLRDASSVESFQTSEEQKAARALLDTYRSRDAEAIRHMISDTVAFQFLDTSVGRLAQKLPTGDVASYIAEAGQEEEDEDLT